MVMFSRREKLLKHSKGLCIPHLPRELKHELVLLCKLLVLLELLRRSAGIPSDTQGNALKAKDLQKAEKTQGLGQLPVLGDKMEFFLWMDYLVITAQAFLAPFLN